MENLRSSVVKTNGKGKPIAQCKSEYSYAKKSNYLFDINGNFFCC